MQTVMNVTHVRESRENSRLRALIRFNALLFHGVATASFLEAAAPIGAGRVARAVMEAPDAAHWADNVWRPQRSARGQALRTYIDAVWPEFDWAAAYDDFCKLYAQRPGYAAGQTNPALEMLACCVLESQAALFYRAIAAGADDPVLRELARAAAREHCACFEVFKGLFEHGAGRQAVGFVASCRVVLASSCAARDIDVAAAFRSLAAHWYGTPTVTGLGYQEFLSRMARLIQKHAGLGCFERLLFSPWLKRARPALLLEGASRDAEGHNAQWLFKAA
jgi:hypothetical protein